VSEAKQRWDEVGDRFSALGRRLKELYDERDGERQRENVDEALRRLGDVIDAGFAAVGESVRDPGVRSELNGAANAIGEAIRTTITEVSARVSKGPDGG